MDPVFPSTSVSVIIDGLYGLSLMHSANYPYLSEGKDSQWFCHKPITLRLHINKVKTKAMLLL